jgi:hypothetical protein
VAALFHGQPLKQFTPAPSLNALSIAEEVAVAFRDLILTLAPVVLMVGLFGLAAFWLSRRSRLHELAHRERLAMIERGLVPPAELQGGAMEFSAAHAAGAGLAPISKAASRFRSAGIMLVGLGVAVATIVAFAAGQPHIAVGVGGAMVAIGAAMIINAAFAARDADTATARAGSPGRTASPSRITRDPNGD